MTKDDRGFGIIELIILIVVLVLIGTVGIVAYKRLKDRKNTEYFNELSIRTNNYYKEQAGLLGLENSEDDIIRRCYRTEQGPFNNGRLWCGISVSKKLAVKPDQSSLQNMLQKIDLSLKAQGFQVSLSGSRDNLTSGFILDGQKDEGIKVNLCRARVEYGPLPGRGDRQDTLEYELSCDNRSTNIVPGFDDDSHNL